ncbi:MAG: HEAT repeat domain-containing protein [Proteobacteria bacterium]|nr:HEAT repeat domain-containing protein [Pseudomonadota bacterium]
MSWLLPPLEPTYSAALRDVNATGVEARVAAAQRLARPDAGDDKRAVEGLLKLAADADPRVRCAAIVSLARLDDTDLVREQGMCTVLARFEDADPHVRELAVIAAAQVAGASSFEALRRALGSPHPEVRFQAAAGIAEVAPSETLAELPPLLRDGDAEVRANAARALGSLARADHQARAAPHMRNRLAEAPATGADARGPDEKACRLEQGSLAQIRQLLRAALDDTDRAVRREAALGLGRLQQDEALFELCDALEDPSYGQEAAEVLGTLADARATEPLARVAASMLKPVSLRIASARSLILLGDQRGIDGLKRVLRGWRSAGRSYAAEVAGELEVVELADSLARLATRPRGSDPVVVARALAKLASRSEPALRALERLASHHGEAAEVARAALESIAAGECLAQAALRA